MGEAASVSSQFLPVREKLVSLQRILASKKSCVMDGIDIASNVLPDANLKLYVDASVDCRAERRYKEKSIEKVKEELADVAEESIKSSTRASDASLDYSKTISSSSKYPLAVIN